MNIGALNKRITLLKPESQNDDYGGMESEFVEMGTVWAQLMQTNYSEQQAQGTPMNRSQLRFKLRPHSGIDRGWKIVFDGQEYMVEVADNTYWDSTTIIVHGLESGV